MVAAIGTEKSGVKNQETRAPDKEHVAMYWYGFCQITWRVSWMHHATYLVPGTAVSHARNMLAVTAVPVRSPDFSYVSLLISACLS